MVFTTIVQLSLGGVLLLAGGRKLLGVPAATATVTRHGYPVWGARVVGVVELTGASAVVAGLWQPWLAIGGSLLIAAVMLGAIHAHLVRSGEPLVRALPALLILTLAAATLIWNAPGLDTLGSGSGGLMAALGGMDGQSTGALAAMQGRSTPTSGGPPEATCSSPRTEVAHVARSASTVDPF